MSSTQDTALNPRVNKGINAEFMDFVAHYLKYTYREDDLPWGVTVVVFLLILISSCFIGNGLVFSFYRKKSSETVSLLYTILSLTDIIVAAGALLTTICLILYLSIDLQFKDMSYVNPAVPWFCYLSFVVFGLSIRVSIFLNAMLTVVRTIMIRDPFREIRKRGIFIALGVFVTIWVFMIIGEVYTQKEIYIEKRWRGYEKETEGLTEEDLFNRKQNLYLWYYIFTSMAGYYHIVEFIGSDLPWSIGLYNEENPSEKEFAETVEIGAVYAIFLITFIIPVVIALACLVLQAILLKKSGQEVGVESNQNKYVTRTIFLLTVLFLVCNSTSIVYCSIASFSQNFDKYSITEKDDDKITSFYRWLFVFQQMLPLLNSTLSPMILIWRGSALRNFAREIFAAAVLACRLTFCRRSGRKMNHELNEEQDKRQSKI